MACLAFRRLNQIAQCGREGGCAVVYRVELAVRTLEQQGVEVGTCVCLEATRLLDSSSPVLCCKYTEYSEYCACVRRLPSQASMSSSCCVLLLVDQLRCPL